jgi:hypothetical protein
MNKMKVKNNSQKKRKKIKFNKSLKEEQQKNQVLQNNHLKDK